MIDRGIGGLMRAVLHHPDLQALEAFWRATFLLVRQLETGSQLKLYLIDISKQELAADLKSATDLRDTGIYRLLVEQSVETPGAEPWAVIVGNYSFGSRKRTRSCCRGWPQIASGRGAPFLAEANSGLLGCASLGVRSASAGVENAPAVSGRLDRTPASARSELHRTGASAIFAAIALREEDVSAGIVRLRRISRGRLGTKITCGGIRRLHVALLLAQSFSQAGWEMRPGTMTEIDRLPLHVYRKNGECESKPCAEVLLTEDASERAFWRKA